MTRRGGCPDCAKYIGKVFIDDVYSGGSAKDGKYPLLSEAISGGLFHPRCKDSTSTYYEGITTLKPATADEIDDMKRQEALERQKSYCENQAEKCGRISKYSLDSDNKRAYAKRAEVWQEKAEQTAEKLDETVAKSTESGIIKSKKSTKNKSKSNIVNRPTKKKVVDYSKTGSNVFSQNSKTELYQNERIISGDKRESAILYNSQGERIFVKKGKKDSVTFTKDEIAKMKNGVLTHNHPNGTVFSPDDINMLRRGQLSEIRACNSLGTYVLRNASEWDDNISDFEKISNEYWSIMNEVGKKYSELSAKEGKPIFYYMRQMDEEGLKVFSEKYGLEFVWEEKK